MLWTQCIRYLITDACLLTTIHLLNIYILIWQSSLFFHFAASRILNIEAGRREINGGKKNEGRITRCFFRMCAVMWCILNKVGKMVCPYYCIHVSEPLILKIFKCLLIHLLTHCFTSSSRKKIITASHDSFWW